MKKVSIAILCFGFLSVALSAQEITSFPGMWGESFYQDKDKLTWKQVDAIMMKSEVAQRYWRKSKKQALGGVTIGLANFGATIWLVSNLDKNEPLTAPAIAAGGTGLIAMLFLKAASKNKTTAILEFNDALDKKTTYRLVPTGSVNGLGLALRF